MLTVYEEGDKIFNSLLAGASGYLLKRTPQAEILEAIAEVHRGNSPMTGISRAKWCSISTSEGAPKKRSKNCRSGNGRF